jgi:release factor glutamine methyltransferase
VQTIEMQKNQTIKALLSTNTSKLKTVLIYDNDAFIEASLLLQHVLKVNRAWLISHEQHVLAPEKQANFETLINQRLTGKPIAYILGEREFYGLTLKVSPDTLIPRADTETLVEAALAKIPSALSQPFRILDLGTGTGAIALAIAKCHPQTCLTAVDASKNALKVAQENALILNIPNVSFVLSNWFDALENQTYEMIVSNPPYIEKNDPHLSQGDLRFEPTSALASGVDGLQDLRKIIQESPAHLKPDGWLLLEHGYNQAEHVTNLLQRAEFKDITHVKDLAGINRVTLARI